MGNLMPNGRSDEHEYPPGAVALYRYIFGDYNTPLVTGPSPNQPVGIVRALPPPNSHGTNSFGAFGVAQSSHFGSSSTSRGLMSTVPSDPRSYNSQLQNDEALAITLQMQEMDNFQNLSMQEPYRAENQDNINVDEMSYEQLQTLQETTGTGIVSKGLSEELISLLPSRKYKPPKKKGNSTDENKECSICMMEYKKGDALTILPCTHQYHEKCIKRWLKNDKNCCLCKKEVVP